MSAYSKGLMTYEKHETGIEVQHNVGKGWGLILAGIFAIVVVGTRRK